MDDAREPAGDGTALTDVAGEAGGGWMTLKKGEAVQPQQMKQEKHEETALT